MCACENVKECICPKVTCKNHGKCCQCVIKHRETDSLGALKESENNLREIVIEKEESDKKLLQTEIVLGIVAAVPSFAMIVIGAMPSVPIEEWLRYTMIAVGLISFLVACFYCVKIEQSAGYYECKKCGNRYVPTYSSTLWAPHVNRTRYMRCPKCNEKSWQKKVISKE